jgi:D-alanine-D-alanine ligase
MDVAILYSVPTHRGQSSGFVVTDTDTEASAKKIADALGKNISARLFPISEHTIHTISEIHTDVFLDLIEWDGLDLPLSLKALDVIEATGIPFTGAAKQNYHMTTDKLLMKKAFDRHTLPTAPWQAFYTGEERIHDDFHYPVIVKLSQTHCSVGLDADAVVSDKETLQTRVRERIKTFQQPVIAEEFIEGREYQVTMLERESGLTMLPPAEIFFEVADKNKFLTFSSRWTAGTDDYKKSHIRMAKFDVDLTKQMERVCVRAFQELNFHDYARFDMRVKKSGDSNKIYFLETNSNPGLDDNDAYGLTLSFKAAGMTFRDFLLEIIASAMKRSH